MPLYLKIFSPKTWVMGDYTSSANYDLEMKIYTDPQMTILKDISAMTTTTLRFIDPNTDQPVFETTQGLTGDASGNLLWKPNQSNSVGTYGHIKIHVIFTESGVKVTAIGQNGSDDLFITAY